MGYLFFQIWLWIIAAFALGYFTHWYLCCRKKDEPAADTGFERKRDTPDNLKADLSSETTHVLDDSWKPHSFDSAPENIDDLKRIKGVGPVIEKTLNSLGVYQFEQISQWNDDNTSWIENFLAFPGRIAREEWVSQSKTLNAGETTAFSKRVDEGSVGYDER